MNIFVANLNFKVQEEDLRETFETYGEVDSARIITDRNTGRSKGFGFVEMPNSDDASRAIEELNDREMEGRNLVVKVAEERTEQRRFTNRRPQY
ncbi:MAG: RNA-binding protein [Bacteroidetes bacterium 4484_276]|nr:MAG: RNA-binding protein [Bacteroidetes bacterium 4484_276]OYT13794.1 MAG: RNA-binding protein [Bacteroidetes bacterium 4572_114]